MAFRDLVKEAERTGGMVKRKNSVQYGPEHMEQANALIEYIKDDILAKAGEGTLVKGQPVALAIPETCLTGLSVTQSEKQHCAGNLLGNLREVTAKTFSVGNVKRVVAIFDAAKAAAQADGILLSDPIILATLYEYAPDDFAEEKVVGHKKYPIQKKKLRAEVKTSIHCKRNFFGATYGEWKGEKAVLSLAVEYMYND